MTTEPCSCDQALSLRAEVDGLKKHAAALEKNETHWIEQVDQLRAQVDDLQLALRGVPAERDHLKEENQKLRGELEVLRARDA